MKTTLPPAQARYTNQAKTMRSTVHHWREHGIERVKHASTGQKWIPHWHEKWTIGTMLAGKGYCGVAGSLITATAGDLIVFSPYTVHDGFSEHRAGGERPQVMMFHVPDLWMRKNLIELPPCIGSIAAPALSESMKQARSWLAIETCLKEAATLIASNADLFKHHDRPSKPNLSILGRFHEQIVNGETSINKLASVCGISREHLHRVVTKGLCMAPSEYVRAVRIQRAHQMLLNGEKSSEVAVACGFADQSHFTKWFRRAHGYTPGDLSNSTVCE